MKYVLFKNGLLLSTKDLLPHDQMILGNSGQIVAAGSWYFKSPLKGLSDLTFSGYSTNLDVGSDGILKFNWLSKWHEYCRGFLPKVLHRHYGLYDIHAFALPFSQFVTDFNLFGVGGSSDINKIEVADFLSMIIAS